MNPDKDDLEANLLHSLLVSEAARASLPGALRGEDFGHPEHGAAFDAIKEAIRTDAGMEPSVLHTLGGADKHCFLGLMRPEAHIRMESVERAGGIVLARSFARRMALEGRRMAKEAKDERLGADDLWGLASASAERLRRAVAQSTNGVPPMHEHVREYLVAMQRKAELGECVEESTGLDGLDRMTMGWHPGELTIIAGRPGAGKTLAALHFARSVLRAGGRVWFASLEMRPREISERLLSAVAGIDMQRMRMAALSGEEADRLGKAVPSVAGMNLAIDDAAKEGSTDIDMLIARASKAHAESPLRMFVLDYLQLASCAEAESRSRNEVVGAISRKLKMFSVSAGIPVLALSQLNREVERRTNRRPMLSDLRDSGALEQDADNVMFLYRASLHNPDDPEARDRLEIILAKQRAGPIGEIAVRILPRTMALVGFGGAFEDGGDAAVNGADIHAAEPQQPDGDLGEGPENGDDGAGDSPVSSESREEAAMNGQQRQGDAMSGDLERGLADEEADYGAERCFRVAEAYPDHCPDDGAWVAGEEWPSPEIFDFGHGGSAL